MRSPTLAKGRSFLRGPSLSSPMKRPRLAVRIWYLVALPSLLACSSRDLMMHHASAPDLVSFRVTLPVESVRHPISAHASPDRSDTLHLARLVGSAGAFRTIGSIVALPNWLVISDLKTNPYLSVLDLSSGAIVGRFGAAGSDRQSFETPFDISLDARDSLSVWVYDYRRLRMVLVDVAQPGAARLTRDLFLDVPQPKNRPMDLPAEPRWLGGKLVAAGYFLDFTLSTFDAHGNSLAHIAFPAPFTPRLLPNDAGRQMMNSASIAVSPSGNRLVVAYHFTSRLDFVDSAERLYRSVEGPHEILPSLNVPLSEGPGFRQEASTQMAYASVQATQNYVYAMFCGCTRSSDTRPTRLEVWKWDGSFVAEYILDHQVEAFTVSSDGSRLWGAFPEPAPQGTYRATIGEWHLPAR